MGLDRQPSDFTCGPYALTHALAMLGVIADPARLARLARTHWWSGTDEIRLARAARAHACDLPLVRRTGEAGARAALVRALRARVPVLACVDRWEHWVTIVHHERGRFVVLDSREEPIVLIVSWRALAARWRYRDDAVHGGTVSLFDMFPVVPRFRREVRAHFTVARARHLRRAANRDVAWCWDQYLADVLEICRPRSPRHVEPLTLGELVRRNRTTLIRRVCYWHGAIAPGRVGRVVRNLRLVADTYGVVVPATATRRALADLAIVLALWAAASERVEPFYAAPAIRRGA